MHALTAEERQRLLAVANEPRFADMPRARIVPMLARPEGVYLASESAKPPTTHVTTWPDSCSAGTPLARTAASTLPAQQVCGDSKVVRAGPQMLRV